MRAKRSLGAPLGIFRTRWDAGMRTLGLDPACLISGGLRTGGATYLLQLFGENVGNSFGEADGLT